MRAFVSRRLASSSACIRMHMLCWTWTWCVNGCEWRVACVYMWVCVLLDLYIGIVDVDVVGGTNDVGDDAFHSDAFTGNSVRCICVRVFLCAYGSVCVCVLMCVSMCQWPRGSRTPNVSDVCCVECSVGCEYCQVLILESLAILPIISIHNSWTK